MSLKRYYLVMGRFPDMEAQRAFEKDSKPGMIEDIVVNGDTDADRETANSALVANPKAFFKSSPPNSAWTLGKDLLKQGIFFKEAA